LLQDIGMLVLDQVLGEPYGEVHSKTNAHTELLALEEQALGMNHAQVAGFLAESWKLPPLLSVPIAQHHTPDQAADPALRKLAEVVQVSGRCADVFVDKEPASAINDVRAACRNNYKMSDADADALLDDIGKRTKEVASLFELNIGSIVEYEAILKKANEALVEITLQTQQQAKTLKKQNQELQIAAATDALSGLANRKRFDDFLADQLGKSVSGNKPLSLLMIDIDKFKSINDTHGHPAGDLVIRTLGKLLKTAARPQDLAARYGGEELALILPGTNRTVASAIAETLRRAISARAVQHANAQIDITASVGVACFEPGSPLNLPSHLIKAADMALYNAKHSGRNCVKVFAMKTAGKTAA
jgi:diguanylate cyclase (GGDEF)-like protein